MTKLLARHQETPESADVSSPEPASETQELPTDTSSSEPTITNQALIKTAQGGYVAFIAPKVVNEGTIESDEGSVVLAAGEKVSLDFAGDKLINYNVDKGAVEAEVVNSGTITANGGMVVMTAKAVDNLTHSVVNNSGVVEAQSIENVGGRIILDAEGGRTTVSGTLDASSPDGKGGSIIVTGEQVLITETVHLNASGKTGGGEVLVGGSWQNSNPDVHQATGTVVRQGAKIEANATDTGDGGTVVIWSDITKADGVTRAYGDLEARGGINGGEGGRIETSGHWLDIAGSQNMGASNGDGGLWLVDPYNINIVNGSGIFDNIVAFSLGATTEFRAVGSLSTIGFGDIANQLSFGDVILSTGNSGVEEGNITWLSTDGFLTPIGHTLTLLASNDIILTSSISLGSMSLILDADSDNNSSGEIRVYEGASISSLTPSANIVFCDDVVLSATNFTINSIADVSFLENINADADFNSRSLTIHSGSFSVSGAIGDSQSIDDFSVTTLFGNPIILNNLSNDFTGLVSASGGDIDIRDRNDLEYSSIQSFETIRLTAGGVLEDIGSGSLSSVLDTYLTGAEIILSDHVGDVISVDGILTLTSTAGSINILSPGTTNFGSLNFTSSSVASISEDSNTFLTGLNSADAVQITSSGQLLRDSTTQLYISGNASLSGASGIDLLGDGGNALNVGGNLSLTSSSGPVIIRSNGYSAFGSLTFNSPLLVSISEDDHTLLTGSNTAGSLTLNTQNIEDDSGTTLTVSGSADLFGFLISLNEEIGNSYYVGDELSLNSGFGSVLIGELGTSNFGALNVNAASSYVEIFEDSSTALMGDNYATTYILRSAGSIEDFASTTITAANLNLGGMSIHLADDFGNFLNVSDGAYFGANGSGNLIIDSAGTSNFGFVSWYTGGDMTLYEDSSTNVIGNNNSRNLTLSSDGAITDSSSSYIYAHGDALFQGTSITLSNNASDIVSVDGHAQFESTSGHILLDSPGQTAFGSLSVYSSGGNATIYEDDGTHFAGLSDVFNLTVYSDGAISSENGSIVISRHDGVFQSATSGISFADNASETFQVSNILAMTSLNGGDLIVGNGHGRVNLLNASTTGDIIVYDNDATPGNSMTLISVLGDNLEFFSTGALLTTGTTTVFSASDATFESLDRIFINGFLDSLEISGNASFIAPSEITIGMPAITSFGSLTFNSAFGIVTIIEDNSTVLAGTNLAAFLTLTSAGSITDDPSTTVVVNSNATFTGTSIDLADSASDFYTITSLANFQSSGTISVGDGGAARFGALQFNGTDVVINEFDSMLLSGTSANNATLSSQLMIEDALFSSNVYLNTASFEGTQIWFADSIGDIFHVGGAASFSATTGPIEILDPGNVLFGSVNFNAPGDVLIVEDDSMTLFGANTSQNLELHAYGNIADSSSTTIIASADSTFSGTNIVLSDTASDVLDIAGDADFSTITLGVLTIGDLGAVNFGGLRFEVGGAVSVFEDSSTTLFGNNFAKALQLVSAGSITDRSSTSVLASSVSMNAQSIFLTDTAADSFQSTGDSDFVSTTGDIHFGSAGIVNFGHLTFNSAEDTTISSEGSVFLMGGTTRDLDLRSQFDLGQGNPITATGSVVFQSFFGDVIMNQHFNDFGAVEVLGGSRVFLNDINSMSVGNVTATSLVDIASRAGDLTLTGLISTDDSSSDCNYYQSW